MLSEEPYDETETTTAAVAEVSLDSGDADAGAGAPVAAPRAAPRTNKSSQVSDIDFFFSFFPAILVFLSHPPITCWPGAAEESKGETLRRHRVGGRERDGGRERGREGDQRRNLFSLFSLSSLSVSEAIAGNDLGSRSSWIKIFLGQDLLGSRSSWVKIEDLGFFHPRFSIENRNPFYITFFFLFFLLCGQTNCSSYLFKALSLSISSVEVRVFLHFFTL